jgi:ADP-ribosylglycohydrolase
MRCSPIALFTSMRTTDEMKLACELSTRITHTHTWSIVGALQQCYAIRILLTTNKQPNSFDFNDYFSRVTTFVHDIEKKFELMDAGIKEKMHMFSDNMQDNYLLYLEQKNLAKMMRSCNSGNTNTHSNSINLDDSMGRREKKNSEEKHKYSNLLHKLHKQYQKCRRGDLMNIQRLHKHVATCGISAMESIPIALFSFVIASDPSCANEVNFKLNSPNAFEEFSPVERVVFYAISYGGDTHKIASMAGALAGAFFSSKDLPKYLVDMCEGSEDMQGLAQRLFDISVPNEFDFLSSRGERERHELATADAAATAAAQAHSNLNTDNAARVHFSPATIGSKLISNDVVIDVELNEPHVNKHSDGSLETKASSSSSCSV